MDAARATEQSARALQPYVPRLAIEWLREQPDERHLAVDGSLAFVDISGFTSLTERLARVGRAGPEELSDILDTTFGALLTATRTDGADLVKWGGDAVLLLFRGDDHAMRAARASYRMQRVLRDVGRTQASAGQVTLRMSVGIHSGRFHFFLVGDPAIHRELIISGPGASVTAEMESIANAGQIVVSDATAALLHPASVGAPASGGRLLRSAPVLPDLAVVDESSDDVDVRMLLPEPVRAHLLAAAGASEHRPVAVAFIQFSQTDALIRDAGAAVAVEAFDECIRNVQQACASHGVSFLESDINRDGGKFMLAAGAPRSSGDDDDRLLRAVQLAVSRQGRLPLRAGINHGRVFAGDFGPAFRRTYSIKGDAINTAARVMGKAEPGTVLATNDVMARARTQFDTQPVTPFLVKGKTKPIHAVLLGAPRGERDPATTDTADDPFVGRETELAALREALDLARARRGSLVEMVAEPGMGKSRLVQEFLRDTGDLVVVRGPSDAYESKVPYYPFRILLRDLLGVSPVNDTAAIAARLAARVEVNAPHLQPWLPLLGIVLDAELPATRETDELDERFRRAKLEEVLVEFLGLVLPTPTLLIFENTQLMDDASTDLLHRIEAGLGDRPWLVLATRRDVATGYVPARTGPHDRSLSLTPIAGALALDLLDAATRSAPLSEHTMERDRGEGGWQSAVPPGAGHCRRPVGQRGRSAGLGRGGPHERGRPPRTERSHPAALCGRARRAILRADAARDAGRQWQRSDRCRPGAARRLRPARGRRAVALPARAHARCRLRRVAVPPAAQDARARGPRPRDERGERRGDLRAAVDALLLRLRLRAGVDVLADGRPPRAEPVRVHRRDRVLRAGDRGGPRVRGGAWRARRRPRRAGRRP